MVELKETHVYHLLNSIYGDVLKDFSWENIFKHADMFQTSTFHKRNVYMEASELCLHRKDVTLHTAIKKVLEQEKKGIPAYRQKSGKLSVLPKIIEEIRWYVELIKANDMELTGSIALGQFVDNLGKFDFG